MATHSSVENPGHRRTWWATVHGVAKESDTTEQLNGNKYEAQSHLGFPTESWSESTQITRPWKGTCGCSREPKRYTLTRERRLEVDKERRKVPQSFPWGAEWSAGQASESTRGILNDRDKSKSLYSVSEGNRENRKERENGQNCNQKEEELNRPPQKAETAETLFPLLPLFCEMCGPEGGVPFLAGCGWSRGKQLCRGCWAGTNEASRNDRPPGY